MALIINNLEEFDTTIENKNVVIAIFFSKTCAQCKAMAPLLDEMIKQTPEITFIKVDIEEGDEICSKYVVRSVGTFIRFINGRLIDHIYGKGKDGLIQLIQME